MKALIAGGGIAGTVSAIALKRSGFDPMILEAFDRSADGVGGFLTLASNGIDAVQALDIDPRLLGGFDTPRMAAYLGNGEELANLPFGRTPSGAVARTIKRSDLYVALRDEAVRRGIPIEYGKRVADAKAASDGGIVVTFADGTGTRGDVLIGADGLHSRVREIIDPGAPKARYIGLVNAGGFAHGIK